MSSIILISCEMAPAKAGGNSWVRTQSYELEWCFSPFLLDKKG